MDFDHTIDYNVNSLDDGEFGKEMGESFERAPANLKMYSGAKILNAPATLDAYNVGLKF